GAGRFDRALLADRARDEDERHVRRELARDAQGVQSVEPRHREIREDRVGLDAAERAPHFPFGIDPVPVRLDAVGLERAQRELDVVRRILHEEHVEEHVDLSEVTHAATSFAAAGAALALNFQALPMRFSSAARSSRGSAFACIPSHTDTSTWRAGSRCCRSAITWRAICDTSTSCRWSSPRDTLERLSRSSISWPMRWVEARMRPR